MWRRAKMGPSAILYNWAEHAKTEKPGGSRVGRDVRLFDACASIISWDPSLGRSPVELAEAAEGTGSKERA